MISNDVHIVMVLCSGPPRDITQRPVYGGGRERGWDEGSRGGGRGFLSFFIDRVYLATLRRVVGVVEGEFCKQIFHFGQKMVCKN